MSDWQERITIETAPSIRVEHDLRYRIAAPLILAAGAWADLGCGNGIAAAAALGDRRPGHVVLVDLDEPALAEAASTLGLPGATQLAGDLADAAFLERIGAELSAGGRDAVVTCFEVLEHLGAFLPLVEWATRLATEDGVTFVISVPNDAFWSIQNPHHMSAWSEGAFTELRGMLPSASTLLRQVAIAGSAIVPWDGEPSEQELRVATGGERTVATHFIAAFGPRHAEVREGALAAQTDQLDQRRWERQRESNLALAESRNRRQTAELRAQSETLREQHEKLREHVKTFEEWRTYIHELEGELGRPLSGQSNSESADPPAQS